MMSGTSRPTAGKGFTLLEVLIALIVLSLVMGSAVSLLRSQSQTFALGSERADLYQNARYVVSVFERMTRTMGAGVAGSQPMLVYGGNDVLAFNADYQEVDTASMRWAVYFTPDADSLATVAWDAAAAGPIPNSTYIYPPRNYTLANGAPSPAETIILYFRPDSSTARTDDYVLYLRFNNREPTAVATNLLADSAGRPFLEYFRLSGGTLALVPPANLPLIRRDVVAGMTPAQAFAAQLPDSVMTVQLNFEVTNGKTGPDEQRLQVSTMVHAHNNGLPQPIVCGRTPLPPALVTAIPDTTPNSGLVTLTWARSPDQGGGEDDIRQYLVFRRLDTLPLPSWDLLANVRADTLSLYTFPISGNASGSAYQFGVSAQDCTPAVSSIAMTLATAP